MAHTGTFMGRSIVATILAVLMPAGHAFADCKLGRIAELPVTMVDMRAMVTGQINGTDVQFAADSGAFYSMITAASAAELGLKTYPAPYGLRVIGVGGEANISAATVKVFTVAGVPLHNVEFLVGGSEVGGGAVGVLGQNLLRIGDVEYDLAKGVIRLMHEDGCGKYNLAYWVKPPEPYSAIDIDPTTPMAPGTIGTAILNGAKIRVLFDSGASTSFISVRAAERAGVKVDAPGVIYAGYSGGIGRQKVKTWIAPFASFKLGDEEIRNTRLRIGESMLDSADMLIGADFFLSHRLYVSNKLRRVFFTYNGGPVFNLRPSASATDTPATPASPDEPTTAEQFSRRGAAFAARRDFEHAIADLTRACELAPDEPNYFYERGIAQWGKREPVPAMADFDRAISIKPDHVPALLARAELRMVEQDVPLALQDLDSVDRFAAKEADARLRLANAYMQAGRTASSIGQLSMWITAHQEDMRLAGALGERCWGRALLGQDLNEALDDCNRALKRVDKTDVIRAQALNARGLVRLRLGDYDKSIADYDASLSLRPKDAWALYGRGVDKLRRGKSSEGRTDLADATATWPPVAAAFEKHGILP